MKMEGQPLVNVLLSAYNGERYIEEQIKSVLTQTYDNIKLYIRDDGSTDRTREILDIFSDNPKVCIIKGENMGYQRSFFQLLKSADAGDYYAYCDQDDVWLPQKMEQAVKRLKECDEEVPNLYFCNYDYYNGEMEYVSAHTGTYRPSFANSLVEPLALGFTMVINRKARDLIVENVPVRNMYPHDWWAYMVCVGMGHVVYDEGVYVKYRRHEENVSFGGAGIISKQKARLKKYFFDDYFAVLKEQCREYDTLFGKKINNRNRRLLGLFCQEKCSFKQKMEKVLWKEAFRQNICDELLIRCILLIGKL